MSGANREGNRDNRSVAHDLRIRWCGYSETFEKLTKKSGRSKWKRLKTYVIRPPISFFSGRTIAFKMVGRFLLVLLGPTTKIILTSARRRIIFTHTPNSLYALICSSRRGCTTRAALFSSTEAPNSVNHLRFRRALPYI